MSVWINMQEYKGAKALKLSLDSEVQKHPIEKGYPVADHIKHQPPSFEVALTLGGTITGKDRNTEYTRLKDLRDKGTPFLMVISDFGSFDNMVISSLSPAIENSSNNTYSCSLTVMQIRVAELKTEYFTINDKDGKEIYSPIKPTGTPPTQALQTKSIANEPVKSGLSWGAVLLSYFKGA